MPDLGPPSPIPTQTWAPPPCSALALLSSAQPLGRAGTGTRLRVLGKGARRGDGISSSAAQSGEEALAIIPTQVQVEIQSTASTAALISFKIH